MIYTVTMNPAIDCSLAADDIVHGRVNRAVSEAIRFGGKGINVSYVLKEFGCPSVITGFTAGFTGDALAAGLTDDGFVCDFIKLSCGTTRINVKLTSQSTVGDPDTEINAPGPAPSEDELCTLTGRLSRISVGDAVVIAGSMPPGISADFVRRLSEALPEDVRLVCDLSGDALRTAVGCSPYFIKPNVHELFELFGIHHTKENLSDRKLIADTAAKLIGSGVQNTLVTLGSDGTYFASANGDSEFIPSPECHASDKIRSAVGCGDSTVAGWLIGMGFGGDAARSLAFGKTKAKSAAELAVMLGTASYHLGFPPSPEKAEKMTTN